MPYVNVKVAGKLTTEQKQKIALEVSETLEKVANKPRAHTYVVIEEVPREDWAIGGEMLG